MRAAVLGLALASCGPTLPDGATRLPFAQDVPLSLGRLRLLVPVPAGRAARVRLTPGPHNEAALSVSACQLDPHQRIDEGDHCLGQAVDVLPDGSSEAHVEAQAWRSNGLALGIQSVGVSADPVLLRIDLD